MNTSLGPFENQETLEFPSNESRLTSYLIGADLLHAPMSKSCKGNGTTVIGLDKPGNNPGAGDGDRLSLSTSCDHWKKMGMIIDRREWVWRN